AAERAIDRDAGEFEHIIIARGRHAAALKQMVADAKERATDNREILIFAEGTRRLPGAAADYKPGYLALYGALDLPIVPVALNSGIFWPPRTNRCAPGKIIVDIAPPIPPGLDRRQVNDLVIGAIETRSDALIHEAAKTHPELETAQAAQARLNARCHKQT
ncbi:MAG: 1-acyl-sn-glycerol-3-phosphate acyltransferase, partial [Pseudomonadota bacterium]